MERNQSVRKQRQRVSNRPYCQAPTQLSCHGVGGQPYFANCLKCHFGERSQRLAELGQIERSARTIEQLVAELAFQSPDLSTHPWLSDVQSFGGAREARVVGHRAKVLELPQLHSGSPTASTEETVFTNAIVSS